MNESELSQLNSARSAVYVDWYTSFYQRTATRTNLNPPPPGRSAQVVLIASVLQRPTKFLW